jgi:acetolactate synthase small subunit
VLKSGTSISREQLVAQADQLILTVIHALEGDQEAEIVRHLLNLKNALTRQEEEQFAFEVQAARARVINVVNNFFHERLTALPTIKEYIDERQKPAHD